MNPAHDRPMTQKQLAVHFGRHRSTIWHAVKRGFEMPGGFATPQQFLEWQRTHHRPRSNKWNSASQPAHPAPQVAKAT